MEDWETTRVIPCVNRSGEPLSVIEQSRADRVRESLLMDGQDDNARRYVLGNGTRVKPLDRDRFVLADTEEVIARR